MATFPLPGLRPGPHPAGVPWRGPESHLSDLITEGQSHCEVATSWGLDPTPGKGELRDAEQGCLGLRELAQARASGGQGWGGASWMRPALLATASSCHRLTRTSVPLLPTLGPAPSVPPPLQHPPHPLRALPGPPVQPKRPLLFPLSPGQAPLSTAHLQGAPNPAPRAWTQGLRCGRCGVVPRVGREEG